VLIDWRSAPVNEQFRAVLGLLEKVTLDTDHVTSDDVRPVLATGVTKQALEDALRICACFNIIARMADALDVGIPSAEGFTQTGIQLIAHGYI
jgi:alkylhydroperoxidase family enzyme